MSVQNFAQKFSDLISRYTKASSPNNDGTNAIMPLTEEQIVSTIHHMLSVLIKKDFDDKNDFSETVNSASAVTSVVQSNPVMEKKENPKDTNDVLKITAHMLK